MKTHGNLYWLYDIAILTIVLFGINLLFLGHYALFPPDEARYAEIAREILQRHDWITPYLNDILYFEKPALFYWLEAFAFSLFGLHEWVARLWPIIFSVSCSVMTYISGRILFNRTTGLYSSIILATSLLFFSMGHLNTLDMALTFMLTSCLFCLIIGAQTNSRLCWFLASFFAACAVLTKGLIGIVFPCMIFGIWIACLQKWTALKRWPIFSALAIFLLLVLPWHIAMQVKYPDFFSFYFLHQHFLRYATLEAHRYHPIYFLTSIFIAGFFPWIVWFFQALKTNWPSWIARQNKPYEMFLLIWFFVIFIFFSLSKSQLIPYILPIFPPAALLVGRYFAQHEKKPPFGMRFGFTLLPIVGIIFALSIILLPQFYDVAYPEKAIYWIYGLSVLILLITGGILSISVYAPFRISFVVLSAAVILLYLTTIFAIPSFENRSIKNLAEDIKQQMMPGNEIIANEHYYQDLPFYTRQRVIIVNWFNNELAFGFAHDPKVHEWMIDNQTLVKKWRNSKNRLFMVTSFEDYQNLQKQLPKETLHLIDATSRNVLISNEPLHSKQ